MKFQFQNPLKNNVTLIIIMVVSNVFIYHIDKNFGYTKTCYTVLSVINLMVGIKLTINSYVNMNRSTLSKNLTK